MKTDKRTLGWFLLLTPIPGLFVTLMLYAVAGFTFSALAASSGAGYYALIGEIVSVSLGFFGIVCVLGIIFGMPLGLMFIVTTKSNQQTQNVEKKS